MEKNTIYIESPSGQIRAYVLSLTHISPNLTSAIFDANPIFTDGFILG